MSKFVKSKFMMLQIEQQCFSSAAFANDKKVARKSKLVKPKKLLCTTAVQPVAFDKNLCCFVAVLLERKSRTGQETKEIEVKTAHLNSDTQVYWYVGTSTNQQLF